MTKEHERVVLAVAVPDKSLEPGDVEFVNFSAGPQTSGLRLQQKPKDSGP